MEEDTAAFTIGILGILLAITILLFGAACLSSQRGLAHLESELAALQAKHDSHVELAKQLHRIGVRIPGERRKTDEPQRQSRTPEGR